MEHAGDIVYATQCIID